MLLLTCPVRRFLSLMFS